MAYLRSFLGIMGMRTTGRAKDAALGGGLRVMLYSTASSCLPPSYTLCVKGLNPRTTDEGLRIPFSRFGHVVRAKVEYNHKKQKSKTYGLGFVTYSSLDAAAAGIKGMCDQFLDGFVIYAEYERPNHIVPRPYTQIVPGPYTTIMSGKRNCSSYGFPASFIPFQVSPYGGYAKSEEAKKGYDPVMSKFNHTNGKQDARKQFIEKGIKEGSDPTLTTKCIREVVDKQCMRKENERSDFSDPMLVTSNYANKKKEVGKQRIQKGDAVNLNDPLATIPSEATMSAATASKMRQHMRRKDIQSEIDDSAASGDNALVFSTRSHSDSQTSSKKIKKFKNANEQSLKLGESIAILAGVCKNMLDDQKLPVKVEELWGAINEMELNDNLAGDAFVFLLERPVHVKALMSTPIGIRKSILVKMIRGAKK